MKYTEPAVKIATALLVMCVLSLSGCKRDPVVKGSGERPALPAFPVSSAEPGSRSVLIIANSRYQRLQPLEACQRDAEIMTKVFQQIGVSVHGGKALIDLTADQMDAAISSFARSLGEDSEAFVYFTGHGAQIGGTNYLLPVNFDAEYENQARRQAISLDSILETLDRTNSRLRVVILDACRDPGNLLPGEAVTKSRVKSKGLDEPRVDAPETLVCFSTKHGSVSLADESASFYSRVLAEEIVKPGRIEEVLRLVARRVYTDTGRRQLPFTYGSLLQDHYFVRPKAEQAVTSATADVERRQMEQELAELKRKFEQEQAPKATGESTKPVSVALAAATPPPSSPKPAEPGRTFSRTNSLGMKFVPVGNVEFCIWETRIQDFEVFATATSFAAKHWRQVGFKQTPDHPVVNVSWEQAMAFCDWLTAKERGEGVLAAGKEYRLPGDLEWSRAVGLQYEVGATPEERDVGAPDVYPWGNQWPPPATAGNYTGTETGSDVAIKGFDDGFAWTAPVGSFPPTGLGIHDLGGNVWEWCMDRWKPGSQNRIMRGGSWYNGALKMTLLSSCRVQSAPGSSADNIGFRCVVADVSPR